MLEPLAERGGARTTSTSGAGLFKVEHARAAAPLRQGLAEQAHRRRPHLFRLARTRLTRRGCHDSGGHERRQGRDVQLARLHRRIARCVLLGELARHTFKSSRASDRRQGPPLPFRAGTHALCTSLAGRMDRVASRERERASRTGAAALEAQTPVLAARQDKSRRERAAAPCAKKIPCDSAATFSFASRSSGTAWKSTVPCSHSKALPCLLDGTRSDRTIKARASGPRSCSRFRASEGRPWESAS